MTASGQGDPGVASRGSLIASVGMVLESSTPSEVRAHVDIDERHHMSRGIVHGGVYATIIESVATSGAAAAMKEAGGYAVGVNNQTDFLRPHSLGRLSVVATPISQGRTLQLWQVEITNDQGRLISRGQVRLFNQYPEGPQLAAHEGSRCGPHRMCATTPAMAASRPPGLDRYDVDG